MTTTYSPDLRIALIGDGDQANVWGDTTNTNLGTLIEQAIAGNVAISVTSTAQAFTVVNGATDQARMASITLTTTVGSAYAVYAPPVPKLYVIYNNSSYTATIYNSTISGNTTAAGAGIAIPAGATASVWSDGTNFYAQNNSVGLITNGVLGTSYGGTGTTTSTGSGSNVLSVSPALTGTPTAPTAASGTNTTQIATTAFVTAATGTLGTMSTQNANAVAITGGTITGSYALNTTGTADHITNSSYNGYGLRTVSSSSPSGGSNGDIWYQV